MVDKVISTIKNYSMFTSGDRILACLSGGADSVAMLLCLKDIAEKMDLTVLAAHYNHRLRGASSDSDEWFCSELCAREGVALYVGRAGQRNNGRTMSEDEARQLRYDFFERTASEHNIDKIATAHNADDNAETVILNLIRGTGIAGLCGIPPVRGNIVRPIIRVGRKEVLDYLKSKGQNYVTDATNFENNYNRNKIRNLVTPVLSQINPSFSETIGKNCELLEQDYKLINDLARECLAYAVVTERMIRIPSQTINTLPFSVAGRVLRGMYCRITKTQGGALSGKHIDKMIKMGMAANASKRLELPLKIKFYASRDEWVLAKDEFVASLFEPIPLINGKSVKAGENPIAVSVSEGVFTGNIENNARNVYNLFAKITVDSDKIKNTLFMRSKRAGDSIKLQGMDGSKSIKKLFNELKIPQNLRDAVPLITDGDKIVAVAGLCRVSNDYCVDDNTVNIMYIQVVEDR